MERTKSQIEKEILENVNESDILQKTNVLLEAAKVEELKRESEPFAHKNEYLAHLRFIHQISEIQEQNEDDISILANDYLTLKRELMRN